MKKFKEFIVLTVKGFIIGLANLIPGVSGGTLAITLGIYEKLIDILSHFFSNFKKNIVYLLPLILGIAISFLTLSKVISYCLATYLFATIMFFLGAILGGLPMLFKKIKGTKPGVIHILVFILAFAAVLGALALGGGKAVVLGSVNFVLILKLIVIGALASATMVVPGVSGSALLMTLGYYQPIINVLKDLTTVSNLGYNLSILVPFGVGVIAGILLIAKLIEYLLRKFEVKTYYGIIGFVISSAVAIIYQNFFMNGLVSFGIAEGIIGVVLCIGGFFAAYKLGEN